MDKWNLVYLSWYVSTSSAIKRYFGMLGLFEQFYFGDKATLSTATVHHFGYPQTTFTCCQAEPVVARMIPSCRTHQRHSLLVMSQSLLLCHTFLFMPVSLNDRSQQGEVVWHEMKGRSPKVSPKEKLSSTPPLPHDLSTVLFIYLFIYLDMLSTLSKEH